MRPPNKHGFDNSELSKLYHKPLPTSPLKYVGGKYRNRRLITQYLLEIYDPYSRIQLREPFAGPASISFEMMARTNIHKYWINDIDPSVFCYLLSLKDYEVLFQKYIRKGIPSATDFKLFRHNLLALKSIPLPEDIIDTAYQKLVVQRLSYSGLGTKATSPTNEIEGRWNAENLCTALEIMHTRIADNDVRITNLDYKKVISNESYPALLYVDPPYFEKGNLLYQYGMPNSEHIKLSELLRKTKHKFLLSYDDCPEIWELYASWAKIRTIKCWHSNSSRKEKKNELLITNS